MIVLDTNVLSEVLRPAPEPRVVDWLKDQPRTSLFTTTVTRGEILYGIRLLPAGKRRDGLWDAAIKIFEIDFAGQVLTFDNVAADESVTQFDALIAGITRSRGAQLATRNVTDFDACEIEVINPWSE